SNDGDKNIVDSVEYIVSRVWADEAGRNRAGVVLVQDQQVFAARDVQKADARPGGFIATRLPAGVAGIGKSGAVWVAIKDARGELLASAIPKVTIVKDGNYTTDDYD